MENKNTIPHHIHHPQRKMAIDRNLSLQRQANLLTGTFKAREDENSCPDMEKNVGQGT